MVEHRSVMALTARARGGLDRRTIVRIVVAGLLAAGLVGWRTAASVDARVTALARLDHRVTATLTNSQTHTSGRSGIKTVVATWAFPTGVAHRELLTTALADRSTVRTLWVDDSGIRVAGPDGGFAIASAIALTLLASGLALTAAVVGVPAWRRYRLRTTVDARWRDLTHHWWEDI